MDLETLTAPGNPNPRRHRSPQRFTARRAAFTLMELMVSIGVLLLLMTMVAWIFRTATRASSVATASNEKMGTVRTADAQLASDFNGLLRDHFIAFWYQLREAADPANPGQTKLIRSDRLAFFTAGDHSAVHQVIDPSHGSSPARPVPPYPWDPSRASYYQILRANSAQVVLGHHNAVDAGDADPRTFVLARRSRLLTPGLSLPALPDASLSIPADVQIDAVELDTGSLSSWREEVRKDANTLFTQLEWMQETTPRGWFRRPTVHAKAQPPAGMHMLFLPGCGEFKIQRWIEHDPDTRAALGPHSGLGMPRWWPEDDRDGDGIAEVGGAESDFQSNWSVNASPRTYDIREYYNGPLASETVGNVTYRRFSGGASAAAPWYCYSEEEVPKAIKITIRLFDPNGRIAEGQVFTMTYTLRD